MPCLTDLIGKVNRDEGHFCIYFVDVFVVENDKTLKVKRLYILHLLHRHNAHNPENAYLQYSSIIYFNNHNS